MADRADDLLIYREAVSQYLERLEDSERRRLTRLLAFRLRRSQQQRIRAQKAPDGSLWPKRKKPSVQKPASRAIRFIYRKASGDERLVDMRSWVRKGNMLTGFDREADGLRTFRADRIAKHLPAEGQADPGPMQTARGSVRRKAQAMFKGLRTARHMKAGSTLDEAYVEFTSRASRLARIHHFGLKDRVVPDGPETEYPQRELLGFSQTDEEAAMDLVYAHMEGRL